MRNSLSRSSDRTHHRPWPALGRLWLWIALATPLRAAPDYSIPYAFTTFAGTASIGSADGAGGSARFNGPYAVAVDATGNVYVADNWNPTIRKITPGGAVTTLAGLAGAFGASDGTGGTARFGNPWGVAVDSIGNVFVADSWTNTIRKITPAGVVSTFAGTPFVSGSADGTGSAAQFSFPGGVAADSAGNIYVADTGNRTLRKITPAGAVTTLAGLAGAPLWNPLDGPMPSLDGTGSAARFISLHGLAADAAGNLYATDENTIRKITPSGMVTTFAGTAGSGNWGSADGTGSAARFNAAYGVSADAAGNVYVADTWNNTIRKITSAGTVTTLAGLAAGYPPAAGSVGATDGAGSVARLNFPQSVAVDTAGNLYVADTHNNTIRKITAAGIVSTLAGVAPAQSLGATDATGSSARFSGPHGLAADAVGNLYVADTLNSTIRKIAANGAVTTLAGTAGTIGSADGQGAGASFRYPYGLATDAAGNVFIADTYNHVVRKITPGGLVTTLAGGAGINGPTDGTGPAARFNYPKGIAVDSAGNAYVADTNSGTIRKITATGGVTTFAGLVGGFGTTDGPGPTARFSMAEGVAVDNAGNVYVADTGNFTIRKITSAGVVSTLAGTAGISGLVDGPSGTARFNGPEGVVVDAAGNVFVADNINYTIRDGTPAGYAIAATGDYMIRRITPAGMVTTLAGASKDSTDGLGSAARFDQTFGLAVNSTGALFVSCSSTDSNTIRRGQLAGPPVITSQPQNATTNPGGSTQFTVTASGAPTPTYQWYFNGTAFVGATNPVLSLANVRSSDAGSYSVVASNDLGSVSSSTATLSVSPAAPPPSTPASGGGGGGAIEPRFLVALALVIGLRLAMNARNRRPGQVVR